MSHRMWSGAVTAASLLASCATGDVIPVAGYSYSSPPSSSYGDSGNELVDGTWSPGINPVDPWVGWEGNPAIVVFDLGAIFSVNSIDVVACNWTAAGVHLPTFVRFEFSDTTDFAAAQFLDFNSPFVGAPPDSAVLHTFVTDTAPTARYVRLTADHDNQWLFLGEVTFNGVLPSPASPVIVGIAACAAFSRRRR